MQTQTIPSILLDSHLPNDLKEIAEKAGLRISFGKTEMMPNNVTKDDSRKVKTKYGVIKIAKQFKYLGEVITNNATDKIPLKQRADRMERAFNAVRHIYSKKNLSINAKLRHYTTVIRPLVLYGSETLAMNRENKNLARIEKRILRMIYGQVKREEGYRKRPTSEIYEYLEPMDSAIIRRKLSFHAHIMRMPNHR